MENIRLPIFIATAYLFLFVLSVQAENPLIPGIMFGFSPFVVIWMVIRVLKDGVPSEHTFEDRFYDDWDHHNGEDQK